MRNDFKERGGKRLNEVGVVISVVVDVDDTLISTDRRMQGVWREILGRDVPLEAVETMGLEQIFYEVCFAGAEGACEGVSEAFLGCCPLFGRGWS